MVLDSNRPPLPAPTEPSTLDSADDSNHRDDVDTNVSTRTDKTSYSVPEDGTPITINTTKPLGVLHKKYPSQTSLLIEYFEAGKEEGSVRSRPSVRVRVTPSSRKNKAAAGADPHVQITKTSNHPRKPAYTRRISLGSRPRDELIDTRTADYLADSEVSSLPPVDIEVLPYSELSESNAGRFMPMASDVSSMPPDSTMGGKIEILPPGRRRSRSLEREAVTESMIAEEQAKLTAPQERRSRSLSKDRIAQRVMEKLAQQQALDDSSKSRSTSKVSKDEITSPRRTHKRRSKDVEEISALSATDSSLLSSKSRSHDTRSGVSGTSSLNNPKLLATVEDAIKRLILPELNALKEETRTTRNRDKFDKINRDSSATYETVDSTGSRDGSKRRVSKSSSAPKLHGSKPKVVLNRSGDDPGTILSGNSSRKGERRSSRGSISSYADSTREEKSSHRRKSKDKEITALAGAGLTAAALKHHTSREEKEEERKHRKHKSSRNSRSRSASISDSVDDTYMKTPIPPLPFNHSELIGGSELTRNSILSAETETKERPESRDSQSSRSTRVETPLHEVARGFVSPAPRTPNALQQALRTAHNNRTANEQLLTSPRSDRSARSREVTQASLEAAAAAKARAIEQSQPHASRYEIESETPTRGVSPVQSEASYQERDIATASPQRMGSIRSGPSVSSLGRHFERHQSNVSIASLESTASTKAARTRKRPQGVTLESKRSILNEPGTPQEAQEFFEKNHEKNEMYRRELEGSEIGSQLESEVNDKRMTSYADDSADIQYLDREQKVDMQDIQKVGSTPEYIHTPLAVESAVASLHDPSSISVRSSGVSSPLRKSMLSQVSPGLEGYMQSDRVQTESVPSGERWGAIRNKAEALAQQKAVEDSPRQSVAKSVDEHPQMHHSAFPTGDELMPEIGYGVDDDSDVTTNPSIIQGPLGGADNYGDHNDELLGLHDERDRTPTSFNKGAAFAGAGAAAAGAAAAHKLRDQSPDSFDQRHQATVEDDYDQPYPGEAQYEQDGYAQSTRTPLSGPTGWKDEGYQSANHGEGFTPQNRNYSKNFDDDGFDEYDGVDLFAANGSHSRHVSGNSHGMDSPLYDSATGKGLDRIESKDIVALMDHLTVRDAQRNARDTEILVTLVRSAAEMRTQIEELKQFIKTEDNMIMQTTDKRVGLAEQRILSGPRAQPVASPRINRSSADEIDEETKKKSNIFKRAIKGLGSKDGVDAKHIQEMLVQLLGEVQSLKQAQQLQFDQQHERSNSLTSYENLRASGHSGSGYEPEGRANTASSPDQSGYLSNPASSRRIQDLHSGYDVAPTNRISTVNEEDEDEDYDNRGYENTERMLTPTQEAFQNKRASQQSPPQASRAVQEPQSQENTPKRKHKSNSSSIFGIPKISRWSKTTSSTNPESVPRNSGSNDRRPYSAHSRSNSQNSIDYYDELDDEYDQREHDRRQAEAALNRDDDSYRSLRSPSPLIPEDDLQYELEDPKYKAHRNSLNLQHPQPRAGPTGRHQNHLETQARIYEPIQSPDFDQWGSMPALARNRLSGGPVPHNMSPISSEASYSQASEPQHQTAPLRMSKMTDEGPLIPPPQTLAGFGQTRQMYSSPNEFGSQGALTPLAPIAEVRYSLETDRGYRMTPTPSPRPSSQHLRASAAMNSPQRKITGPRPMGSRSPAPQSPLQHSDTVVRRKPIEADEESLESYRSSLDSEIF